MENQSQNSPPEPWTRRERWVLASYQQGLVRHNGELRSAANLPCYMVLLLAFLFVKIFFAICIKRKIIAHRWSWFECGRSLRISNLYQNLYCHSWRHMVYIVIEATCTKYIESLLQTPGSWLVGLQVHSLSNIVDQDILLTAFYIEWQCVSRGKGLSPWTRPEAKINIRTRNRTAIRSLIFAPCFAGAYLQSGTTIFPSSFVCLPILLVAAKPRKAGLSLWPYVQHVRREWARNGKKFEIYQMYGLETLCRAIVVLPARSCRLLVLSSRSSFKRQSEQSKLSL